MPTTRPSRIHKRRAGLFETVLAVTLAAISVVFAVTDAFEPWSGQGDFGFTVETGGRVTSVVPGSVAQAAGLETGDEVDVGAMDVPERRYLVARPPAGMRVTVPVDGPEGKRVLELRATPYHRTAFQTFNVLIADAVAVALPLFAITLVFLRPSGLTWALLLYAAIGSNESGLLNTYAPLPLFVILKAYADLLWYSLWIVVFAFVLRFPNDHLDEPQRRADRALRVALVVVLCLSAYVTLWPVLDNPGVEPIAFFLEKLDQVGAAAALLTLFAGFLRAAPQDRPRIGWILAGFGLGLGGQLLSVVPSLGDFPLILNLAVPLSIAYAIRHRVIDIRFALSRALVYGAMTTLAVVSLALIHYFISKQFEEFHLGFLFDLAGAVVHGFVEAIFDRFVFRDVHDADQRLERAGAAMLHARSSETVVALLCEESASALRLAGVAVFLSADVADEAAPYRRAGAVGWDHATLSAFSAEDALVLYLKGEEGAVDASALLAERPGLPAEAAAPVLAVPLLVRHRMTGFVLFGAHLNGSDLDPDERKLLAGLTRSAAGAIEHALVEMKIAENATLRAENAVLKEVVTRVPGSISN